MATSKPANVFAVQCPQCKKYVLVEAHDRGQVVSCLLCKTAIRVGGAAGNAKSNAPRK